jgi:hypothetical protein
VTLCTAEVVNVSRRDTMEEVVAELKGVEGRTRKPEGRQRGRLHHARRNTARTAKQLEDWDGAGLPPERGGGGVKIVPPITITDAMLISSNVSEGPAADYNAGTTYAAGDVVSGATANSLKYQWASLQNGNIGHTPGVSGRRPGGGPSPTRRAIRRGTSPTVGAGDGAQIDGDDVHQLWWSVVDDNLGNAPRPTPATTGF